MFDYQRVVGDHDIFWPYSGNRFRLSRPVPSRATSRAMTAVVMAETRLIIPLSNWLVTGVRPKWGEKTPLKIWENMGN